VNTTPIRLGEQDPEHGESIAGAEFLESYRLDQGLPVWRYDFHGARVEKRIHMPYRQNTTLVTYTLLARGPLARMRIFPRLFFRPLEAPLVNLPRLPYTVSVTGERYEFGDAESGYPPLRVSFFPGGVPLLLTEGRFVETFYRAEQCRGYESRGMLWEPGSFRLDFAHRPDQTMALTTEPWSTLEALPPGARIYKVGTAGFYDYSDRAAVNGNEVALYLTDGGAGDADGVANGVILDPVGIATPAGAAGSSSGGGGGCVLDPEAGFGAEWLVLMASAALLLARQVWAKVRAR